jgi:hypothetical protein
MMDEDGYPMGSRQVHHYVAQMNLGRFSVEPDRENPPLWTLESGSGRIRKSSVRNEAAITDYNRLDNSGGEHEPELAEQAFSEIETLARPVLDKISVRQALTPRERIALATFLQLQYQRTPRMRENMRFVTREAARLWAHMKLSDREHVRDFLENEGRTAGRPNGPGRVAAVPSGGFQPARVQPARVQSAEETISQIPPNPATAPIRSVG